ncbi:uncharacterized protein CMC5_045640 [Chondromyces crocatus]|uniref:Uncharacterized protein n=1 Tax=Chondromyces crocatus TaxID=52 RepID=A0A0K1EHQ7_CHOCO|nr:uncharacterized protein CMC5_045640 [Chondromyces crocatus]
MNVTGTDGLTILVDEKPVAENVKHTATENEKLVAQVTLSSGPHKIEAKDASGKVLESFTIDIDFGGRYLYAPARPKGTCFFVQTDEYKSSPSADSSVKDRFKALDKDRTIWKVESIDYWFQDSPESVTIKTKKGSSSGSVIKRSLRQAACDDPDFAD